MARITHVIFDVDGLLLDTETVYTKIMNILAGSYGKEFTMDIKRKQMGKPNAEAAKEFIEGLGIDLTIDDYKKKIEKLEDIHFRDVELMPGAERIVRHFASNKIPMALATGSSDVSLRLKASKHQELFKLFSHTVHGSDQELKRGKPSPDIFLLAMNRFEDPPLPENCLVFEDGENGVLAGLSAKMNVVWIPDLNVTPADVSFEGPVHKLGSLNQFDPEEFGLPKIS